MAKVAFSKLGLKKNEEIVILHINGQEIEVKQYLPINEKLMLIANVINQSADDNNFANPVKLDVFTSLEIIFAYTNISFTDKQKEDLIKLYDLLEGNDIINIVLGVIPDKEYNMIRDGVMECADAIYTYQNSIMGILENVSADYSNLDLDATNIQQKIADSENIELLKNVLTKLG